MAYPLSAQFSLSLISQSYSLTFSEFSGLVSESDGSCENSSRPRIELCRVSVEPGLKHRRLEFRSPRDFDCASDYSGDQIENGREYNPAPIITAGVLSATSDIVPQKLSGIQKLQLKRLLLKVLPTPVDDIPLLVNE
ncbi:hypothetical protein ACS0TY_007423 [Phlomoides rotata]